MNVCTSEISASANYSSVHVSSLIYSEHKELRNVLHYERAVGSLDRPVVPDSWILIVHIATALSLCLNVCWAFPLTECHLKLDCISYQYWASVVQKGVQTFKKTPGL